MDVAVMPSKKCFAIFCGYNETDIRNCSPFIAQLHRMVPGIQLVGVNNSQSKQSRMQFSDLFTVILDGDNEGAEFGAYQSGLDYVLSNANSNPSGAFFLNDTIWKKGLTPELVGCYAAIANSGQSNTPILFGKCDSYGSETFEIGNVKMNRWVSTHLFYLSSKMLMEIGNRVRYDFVSMDSLNDAKSRTDVSTTEFFADLDPLLARKLDWWLFKGGWHYSSNLLPENYFYFRKKLRSILNELYLGGLCQQYGQLICSNEYIQWFESFARALEYNEQLSN